GSRWLSNRHECYGYKEEHDVKWSNQKTKQTLEEAGRILILYLLRTLNKVYIVNAGCQQCKKNNNASSWYCYWKNSRDGKYSVHAKYY
ncbi:MAG: hypothetical protein COU33_02430, partial [Candidatus Magasanikbacteria bacterium CG10_big_fil_rev_8_21_14_0_10_43_6]